MSNEKNNEVIGMVGAVALLIALTVTAGTVIYGAFGGYGSFYEMFCASVRNVLITWAISATIALLFSAIAGIIILFGRLCLNAWKHPRTAITLAILGLLMFWQWYAEVSRSKQAMASDPWSSFADAPDPRALPPPGSSPSTGRICRRARRRRAD